MKVYSNDLCPCGSGKKYKNCCMRNRIGQTGSQTGTIGVLPVYNNGEDPDFFVNQRGAVVFKDESKQPVLEIPEGSMIKTVLSVGISKTYKPMATIQEDEGAICYLLPDRYLDWCQVCIGLAVNGVNFFPADVEFSRSGDKFAADIL